MLLEENAYGVPNLTTGAPTAAKFNYIRLDTGNAFAMRSVPEIQNIPRGGGDSRLAVRVAAGQVNTVGKLSMILHYTQAERLLNWATKTVNAGRTTPWVTTDASNLMPEGDLASVSLYHAIMRNDGTYRRRAYRGVKVARLALKCARQAPIVRADFDLIAQKPIDNDQFGGADASDPDATEFPAPADTDFPTDPVIFQHINTTDGLKIGTKRTFYEAFNLNIKNDVDPFFCESRFPGFIRYCGRQIDFDSIFHLKVTPNDRADFEAQTVQDCEATFETGTTPSKKTLKFELYGSNYINSIEDSLELAQAYRYSMSLQNLYNVAATADFSFTYSVT